jgi:hypothetical protein
MLKSQTYYATHQQISLGDKMGTCSGTYQNCPVQETKGLHRCPGHCHGRNLAPTRLRSEDSCLLNVSHTHMPVEARSRACTNVGCPSIRSTPTTVAFGIEHATFATYEPEPHAKSTILLSLEFPLIKGAISTSSSRLSSNPPVP